MDIEKLELHELHAEDLKNPNHPSSFEVYDDYKILMLRIPERFIDRSAVTSHAFVITKDAVYFFDKKTKEMELIENGLMGIYEFLDKKIDKLLQNSKFVNEKVLLLEEKVFKGADSVFLKSWLEIKKDLSHSTRLITSAEEVLELFNEKMKYSATFPINEFRDIHEHLERSKKSNLSALEQIDNLYRYYNLRASDAMNKSIYILAIVSVVFLPLNLGVGFFGMNTSELPFSGGSNGTYMAMGSMMTFAVIVTGIVMYRITKWKD